MIGIAEIHFVSIVLKNEEMRFKLMGKGDKNFQKEESSKMLIKNNKNTSTLSIINLIFNFLFKERKIRENKDQNRSKSRSLVFVL